MGLISKCIYRKKGISDDKKSIWKSLQERVLFKKLNQYMCNLSPNFLREKKKTHKQKQNSIHYIHCEMGHLFLATKHILNQYTIL